MGALLLARERRFGQPADWHRQSSNDLLRSPRTGTLREDLPTCSGPVAAVSSLLHRWRHVGLFEPALQHRSALAEARSNFA